MTKLYKSYKVSCKTARSDAATIDGINGFAHVSNLKISEVIDSSSFSWMPGQQRTIKLVKVAGGEFGTMAEEGEAFPKYAQELFTDESAARTKFAAICASYESSPKWLKI